VRQTTRTVKIAIAFKGLKASQETAEEVIRDVLGNPSRVQVLDKYIDVYNAAGKGVRFSRTGNKFVGFLEASRAKK
jgi:hypothetical protein